MDRFYFYKYEFWIRIVKILVSMKAFKVVYVKNCKTSFSSKYIPHKAESINVAGYYIVARETVCFNITYFYTNSIIEAPIENEKKIVTKLCFLNSSYKAT